MLDKKLVPVDAEEFKARCKVLEDLGVHPSRILKHNPGFFNAMYVRMRDRTVLTGKLPNSDDMFRVAYEVKDEGSEESLDSSME